MPSPVIVPITTQSSSVLLDPEPPPTEMSICPPGAEMQLSIIDRECGITVLFSPEDRFSGRTDGRR